MKKKRFNLKRGVAGVKQEAKKLPRRTLKQIPNAAMFVTGGVAGAAAKGASMAAKRAGTKKAVKSFKLPGQKKRVKVNYWRK